MALPRFFIDRRYQHTISIAVHCVMSGEFDDVHLPFHDLEALEIRKLYGLRYSLVSGLLIVGRLRKSGMRLHLL